MTRGRRLAVVLVVVAVLAAMAGPVGAQPCVDCLEAGATTVQVYTAFVYQGPRLVRSITDGLAAALRARSARLA